MTEVPDFAVKPTLTGERAVLRPFIDGDTPALLAALGDPDVRILTGSVHDESAARAPATPQEQKLAAGWYATRNDADDRLDLAVVDRANESLRYGDQWIDATVMSILAPEWLPSLAT